MPLDSVQWGQILTILLMALALGMDAFSLGIGIGIRCIRLLAVAKISMLIGLFHVIMPLMGMFMGQYVSTLLDDVAVSIGGGLLVLLGSHMIYNSFRGSPPTAIDLHNGIHLVLFAMMVSIDSFSVGVSLGMFASDIPLTVISFGVVGGCMALCGLLLGRKAASWVGAYGEAFGGLILLVFGIRFLI